MNLSAGSTMQCVVVMVMCIIVCCSGCFVRNCPPGGKRSMESVPQVHSQRQCMRCGPEGFGQCLGPNICCGPAIGCYINTIESSTCEKENEILTPCEVEGDICGPSGQGKCVADGVCCSDEACTLDSRCDFGDEINEVSRRAGHYSPDLVRMLRRILERRGYEGRK